MVFTVLGKKCFCPSSNSLASSGLFMVNTSSINHQQTCFIASAHRRLLLPGDLIWRKAVANFHCTFSRSQESGLYKGDERLSWYTLYLSAAVRPDWTMMFLKLPSKLDESKVVTYFPVRVVFASHQSLHVLGWSLLVCTTENSITTAKHKNNTIIAMLWSQRQVVRAQFRTPEVACCFQWN